jgi:hypothetical protein
MRRLLTRAPRSTLAVLAAGALAVGACVVPSLIGAPAEAQPVAIAVSDSEASAISPLFAVQQSADDALPGFLVSGRQAFDGLRPSTARHLGKTAGANYWIALSETRGVCLISLLDGLDENAAMTCQSPTNLWRSGLALQVADQTRALRSYFLPSGYQQDVPGYKRAGDQLIVGDASKPAKSLQLSKSDSNSRAAATLTLPAFETQGFSAPEGGQ